MNNINGINYIGNNNWFVTFGDDKRIIMWEDRVNLIVKNLYDDKMPVYTNFKYL